MFVLVAAAGCSSGTTESRADNGTNPTPDGSTIEPDAAVRPVDGRIPPDVKPDLPPPPDPKRASETVSGAGRSTSTSYELHSQVGMPMGTTLQSGATYALRWNAAVIPW